MTKEQQPQPAALTGFHPVLADWFNCTFGEPTDVQQRAWLPIRSGRHTLIAAPTGSGKTLAALLPCLDAAVKAKAAGSAGAGGVKVLYITPLKALNNDIHHHIAGFADAIEAVAAESGLPWPGLRAAVRTGDTTSAQRAAMLRRPPDVLVTTPESLFILLTSDKGRQMLRTVTQVIVDEIHDLAADKRGAHLSLSLERLTELAGRPIQRIGVSATQKPLERVARFLAGWEEPAALLPAGEDGADGREAASAGFGELPASPDEPVHPLGWVPRPAAIVESLTDKRFELTVTMPDAPFGKKSEESVWTPIVDRMMQLMEGTRSVLIFVNSRRLAERLTLRLNDHVGYEMAKSHHGSVARERRLEVERQLKSGELRVIVATSSLELGIDVGHVDLVIQLDSPLAAAAGIQRIGRAGHAVGDVSRGVIVARARGQLPEIAVLSGQIAARDIEPIKPLRSPLDVLSQHVVAMAAAAPDGWRVEELHKLVCRSDSFRSFPLERLYALLQVLGGYYPFARPLVDYDERTSIVAKRANSAMAALTGAGTIPSSSGYPVHHAETRIHLGELDEEFIEESRVGDVFQLGTSSWMIQSIRQDRIYVTEAGNRYSEIPFWRNEAGGRGYALGVKVGQLWGELERRLVVDADEAAQRSADAETASWLARTYLLDGPAADALILFVRSQLAFSAVPTDRRIVVEYYLDVTGRCHVVLHNHWGKRVNRTWLLAIERRLSELIPYRVYGNAKDGGIEFVLPEWGPAWLQAVRQVTADNAEQLLVESIHGSPMLGIAFRRIAETSLLLSRSFTRTPMWQKRIRSEELLKAALPFADRFPHLAEAMRECLYDYLDLPRLTEALRSIERGEVEFVIRETEHPSPLAAQFAADYATMQLYEGDQLGDAVQLQLMQISRSLAGELFGRDAMRQAVSPEAIEAERLRLAEPGPGGQPQGADDLYALLKRRGDLSADELAQLAGAHAPVWLAALERAGRAAALDFGGMTRWMCADERGVYDEFPSSPGSIAFVAGRFAEHVLSFTAAELADRYPALSPLEVQAVIDELLLQERIEPAPFAEPDAEAAVWTSRRIAGRIIRLSVREARKQAEPIAPVRWLQRTAALQYVLHGTQRQGDEGLLAVVERLQGIFLPLSLWESVIFPSRLSGYRKEQLDLLCAGGELIWLGRKEPGEREGRVAFFLADDAKPLFAPVLAAAAARPVRHPQLLARLQEGGAAFLTKLARESDRLPSELLADLFDLAWDGHVSNDQFAPLRIASETKGRQLAKTGSGQGRWYAAEDLLPEAAGTGRADTGDGGGPAVPREQSVMAWARHLAESFGLLTKDLADAVSPIGWDELLPVLKQLEQWGVVTRGLFVQDVQTMQFVLRELVPTLRQPLPEGTADAGVTVLSALDPANPYGVLMPWPSRAGANFARKAGSYLVLADGEWVLWVESNGKRIWTRPAGSEPDDGAAEPTGGATDSEMGAQARLISRGDAAALPLAAVAKTAFRTLMALQRQSKIKIDYWNGEPAAESAEGAALLHALGAERDRSAMVLWLSALGR